MHPLNFSHVFFAKLQGSIKYYRWVSRNLTEVAANAQARNCIVQGTIDRSYYLFVHCLSSQPVFVASGDTENDDRNQGCIHGKSGMLEVSHAGEL